MFIINPEMFDIYNNDFYYICNKQESDDLQKKGFSLFSAIYDKDMYIFVKTTKLKLYLQKGGEKIVRKD